jgi:hypothetical protein
MLSVVEDDESNARDFSRWLEERCPRTDPRWSGCGELALITDVSNHNWGGFKHPECVVYAGTLNHARLDAVIEQFGRIPWRVPNAVQLFLMDQEQVYFRLWMIRDGGPKQHAPEVPDENGGEFWPANLHESIESQRERLARKVADGVGTGNDLEEVLAALRAEHTDFIAVILAVRAGLGIGIGEAKNLVVTSEAWRDYAEAHTDYLEFAERSQFKDLD